MGDRVGPFFETQSGMSPRPPGQFFTCREFPISAEARAASPERKPTLKFILPLVVSLRRPEEKVTTSVEPSAVVTPPSSRDKGKKGSKGRSKGEKGKSKNKKGKGAPPLAMEDKKASSLAKGRLNSPPRFTQLNLPPKRSELQAAERKRSGCKARSESRAIKKLSEAL